MIILKVTKLKCKANANLVEKFLSTEKAKACLDFPPNTSITLLLSRLDLKGFVWSPLL